MGETDREKLGLVLMDGAMLRKSLIQFSIDGWSCVPSLLFDLRPNYGGGNEDNGAQPCSRLALTHAETPGHSQVSLGQSSVESLLLSPGSWCAQGSVCALQGSVSSPV